MGIWQWKSFKGCIVEEKEKVSLAMDVASRLDSLTVPTMRAFAKELQVSLTGRQTKLELADAILTHLQITNKDEILAKILMQKPKKTDDAEDAADEERAPYYDDEYDDDDSGEAAADDVPPLPKDVKEASSKPSDPSMGPPVLLPERPECLSEPPPGCSLRILESLRGASPRWRGELPPGETWLGQHSISYAFDPNAKGNPADDADAPFNMKGARATATERAAQLAVQTWL